MSNSVAPEIKSPVLEKLCAVRDSFIKEIYEIKKSFCKSDDDIIMFMIDVPETNSQTIGFAVDLDVT